MTIEQAKKIVEDMKTDPKKSLKDSLDAIKAIQIISGHWANANEVSPPESED